MLFLVTKSCPTLLWPHELPARLLFPWDFPGKNTRVGCHFLLHFLLQKDPGDLSDPGIEPTSPSLAGRFFTTEPLGKPKLKDITFRLIEKNGLKKEEKVPKQKRGQGKRKEREHCGTYEPIYNSFESHWILKTNSTRGTSLWSSGLESAFQGRGHKVSPCPGN